MGEIDIALPDMFQLCPGKAVGMCPVKHCRNACRERGRLCEKHSKAYWRARNPVKAAWNQLKGHASSRKREFGITFEQFQEICKLTGYGEGRGNRPEDLAVDRIDNARGYTLDNIRVITVAENGRKGAREGRLRLSAGQSLLWEQVSLDAVTQRRDALADKYDPRKKFHEAAQETDAEEVEDALALSMGWKPEADEPF